MEEKLLRQEERAIFALRGLYRRYGYLPYQMSKFEEYELYAGNKEFLVSDQVITFHDTNGRLMALKPDVTLSIIKNGEDLPGCKQKVCYNENVYRVSESTGRYKEIMQTGLECIGDIDLYDVYEVVTLAAQSLSLVSDRFVLEISHIDLISQVLEKVCSDTIFAQEAMNLIAAKNAHDLIRLCDRYSVSENGKQALCALVSAKGSRHEVLNLLQKSCQVPALEELKVLSDLLDHSLFSDQVSFDFSVTGDIRYYNGFSFKGYLEGICDSVLSGGQYDRLVQKMGRQSRAIGFALYLDMLENLHKAQDDLSVDVLLLYDEGVPAQQIAAKVQQLLAAGRTVSTQKGIPEKLRYRELTDLRRENKC